MIEGELRRLRERLTELQTRVIPALESKTEALYMLILPLHPEASERESLESEYTIHFKELRLRSDEIITIKQQIANLETQLKNKDKPLLRKFR